MELVKNILKSKEFGLVKSAFQSGRLSHAYLIFGEDAISNHAFLKAITLMLVCENHDVCFECIGCKKIAAGFHPDVFVYPKGKNFAVSDSEDIIENAKFLPMESKYKVFVIHSIDNATVQAQNKLLKIVEEAPKNVVFLFDAVNNHNVLQTIKSRAQEIQIKNFNFKRLEDEEEYAFLFDMVNNLNSTKQTILYAPKFAEKTGFLKRLEVLAEIYERLLLQKTLGTNYGFNEVESSYHIAAIAEILDCITKAKQKVDANVATTLIADTLLIKILEVRYKWSKA